MAYHQYFPEELIQLNQEVTNHPALMTLLAKHSQSEWLLKFLEICTYCKVAVDGEYTEEDLRKVALICIERLQKRRAIIITTPPERIQ